MLAAENPVTEQVNTKKILRPCGKPMLEQASVRTSDSVERRALIRVCLLSGLVIHNMQSHVGVVCS